MNDVDQQAKAVQADARDLAAAYLAGKPTKQLREQYTAHQSRRPTTKTS